MLLCKAAAAPGAHLRAGEGAGAGGQAVAAAVAVQGSMVTQASPVARFSRGCDRASWHRCGRHPLAVCRRGCELICGLVGEFSTPMIMQPKSQSQFSLENPQGPWEL